MDSCISICWASRSLILPDASMEDMKSILSIFALLTLFMIGCRSNSTIKDETKKPNILFLLADDLGYGELGSYGQKTIQTPKLDDLAKQGMRFTDFYAGTGSCKGLGNVIYLESLFLYFFCFLIISSIMAVVSDLGLSMG